MANQIRVAAILEESESIREGYCEIKPKRQQQAKRKIYSEANSRT